MPRYVCGLDGMMLLVGNSNTQHRGLRLPFYGDLVWCHGPAPLQTTLRRSRPSCHDRCNMCTERVRRHHRWIGGLLVTILAGTLSSPPLKPARGRHSSLDSSHIETPAVESQMRPNLRRYGRRCAASRCALLSLPGCWCSWCGLHSLITTFRLKECTSFPTVVGRHRQARCRLL